MRGYNAYNTTDPAKLLALKKEEAGIILEVVRSIHPTISLTLMIETVATRIIEQLDVRKLLYLNTENGILQIRYQHNFPPVDVKQLEFLTTIRTTQAVNANDHPALFELGAEFIIPLGSTAKECPSGWFIIADFAESEEETQNDLIFIETIGNILTMSIEISQLFQEKLAQEVMQQELEVAAKIQKQALPQNLNLSERLDVDAVNIAHSKVAGDFYDIIPVNDDEIYFCIADVSGKGIAAALLVATLQANLRAVINSSATFHQIIKQLHNAIARITRSEHYVTLFLSRLNVQSMRMAYVNAGHNPPYVVRGERVHELNKGCIPLGILPVESVEIGYEKFSRGDLLFLYTDGIVEQLNTKEEFMQIDELKGLLVANRFKSSSVITAKVLELVDQHAGEEHPGDDKSMMVIRFV
jgi:sigma-B regulation protein RsbU (phosphoserine phosphatase)